jgi:hypothetical protein
VVTFLFTDAEGSSRRREADPDGMRAALAADDDVLRSVIEARRSHLPRHGPHHPDAQPPGCPRRSFRAARPLQPAATIAGLAVSPLTATLPEFNAAITHLRDALGDETYESLARKGETMTTAVMVTYAFDQIDQNRTELNADSKKTETGPLPGNTRRLPLRSESSPYRGCEEGYEPIRYS